MSEVMKSDSSYYDPARMEYSSTGYETDPMDASYYNQASVFLRQPVCTLDAILSKIWTQYRKVELPALHPNYRP